METDNEFKVWIGCLGCYNAGYLAGEWFDADAIPDTMQEWQDKARTPAEHTEDRHEELWVMEHENSPVEGEYSVTQAREYAGWLEAVDHQVSEPLQAYIANLGRFDEDTIEGFQDSYKGCHDEVADVVAEMHEGSELPEWAESSRWTIYRDIASDWMGGGAYWTEDAPMGQVHVFAAQ